MLTPVGLVLLVGLNDFAVFKNMGKLSKYLDLSRLAVTVVVLGALLVLGARSQALSMGVFDLAAWT